MEKKKYYKGEDFWDYLEYLSKNENLVFKGITASLCYGYCQNLNKPIEVYVEKFSQFLENENLQIKQFVVNSLDVISVNKFGDFIKVTSQESTIADLFQKYINKIIGCTFMFDAFKDYYWANWSFSKIKKLIPNEYRKEFDDFTTEVAKYVERK